MQQLNIGQLRSTRHAALVPYERTKCVTFVRADVTSTSQPPIAALAESIFLQLLKFHPPGAAESIFYEAAPSLDFAEVKRLYALTNGRYGRQITQRAELTRQLATLAEIIHTRFSLFAAAGVSSLREYNAISPRAEKWHYVLIVGDGAIAHGHGSDESPLQMLQTICRQGPAAGIVMVLVLSIQS